MQSEETYEPPFSDEEGSRAGSEEASDISDDEHPALFPQVQRVGVEQAGNPTPFRKATAAKRQLLTPESLHNACHEICLAMEDKGINLPIFLDEISWGSDAAVDDGTIRYQRTALFQSIEFRMILDRWYKPPRSPKKKRPAGGTKTMHEFALEAMVESITTELKVLAPMLRLPAGADVDPIQLTGKGMDEMRDLLKSKAPTFWNLLHKVLSSDIGYERLKELPH